MKPLRFWNQFDFYVRIPVAERTSAATNKAKKSANKKQNKKQQQIISNDQQQEWELSTRRIVRILQRALGNRVHALRVLSTGNGDVGDGKDSDDDSNDTPDLFPNFVVTKNNVKSTNPRRESTESPTGTGYIVLGISVDPEASQRIVDRGPPAEHNDQVKSFVELWGSKAQLRRFKDGAIVQAVIWNSDNESSGSDSTSKQIR